MAPILSFTAEEVWEHLPGGAPESVHLAAFPDAPGFSRRGPAGQIRFFLKVRGEINRGLEEARKDKRLATAQEAAVILGPRRANFIRTGGPAGGFQTLAQVAVLRGRTNPGPSRESQDPGL